MNIYGSKPLPLPTPKFIVFYNGMEEQPECQSLCLSESYMTKDEEVSLELKVDMLNINVGHNQKLMEASGTLRDYSEYVYRVRKYAKTMGIKQAVDKTIEECIRENILREFLQKHKAEAKAMSIYEYNQEEHMRMEREEFFEDGRKQGIEEGREEERANTERERLRANDAERRAEEAEAKVERLLRELAELTNNSTEV